MSTALDSTSLEPKSELDLSKPEDVLVYLADTRFASTRAEPLSGGIGNFVFRLHLLEPLVTEGGVKTVVLKHAKGWVATNKTFEYDINRQNIEALALRHVHTLLPADSLVTVPALFHHDPGAHVLIMEDAGPDARNLKDLLRESPLSEPASRELGTGLGRFLAAIHVHGTADAELLGGVQKNDDSRRITAWITYGRVEDTLKELSQETGLIEPPLTTADMPSYAEMADINTLVETTIKKIYDAQTTFTMGDFWTGNIVVRLTRDGSVERAFVVDWEVSKPGLPFIDFAQFAAEMHTLRRFHPEADASVTAALKAYEVAYKHGMKIDEGFVRSAASHVGAHMITVTPSVANWGSKEKTREVVKEGIEYLLGGLHENTEWLRASAVGSLLSDPIV